MDLSIYDSADNVMQLYLIAGNVPWLHWTTSVHGYVPVEKLRYVFTTEDNFIFYVDLALI